MINTMKFTILTALLYSSVGAAYDIESNSYFKKDTEYMTVKSFNKLVKALIAQESAGNPDAVSHAGALGLMQVMPATAAEYEKICNLAPNSLLNVNHNISVGTCILSVAIAKYKGNIVEVLIRYNAGGRRVLDYRKGKKLPTETQNYINRTLWRYYND